MSWVSRRSRPLSAESEIDGISKRMLTVTLRKLKLDGLVGRTVYPEVSPRVEYELASCRGVLRLSFAGRRVLLWRVLGGLNFVRLGPGYAGSAELFSLAESCGAQANGIQQTWQVLQGFTLPGGLGSGFGPGREPGPERGLDGMSELLARHDDVVVSGTAENQGRFYDRFEHVVLLSAPVEVLVERADLM